MTISAEMGHNKTGAQMSPNDTKEQLEANKLFPPDIPGDAGAIARERMLAISEAAPVGSVPVPGSVKGMIKTSFQKVLGKNPEILIDKMAERLAFERTGVRLYDAMLAKVEALGHIPGLVDIQPTIQRFRDEEHQHYLLLADALEKLGADPTAQTPSANLAGVSAEGIVKIIADPRTNLVQSMNALLIAEAADNIGWELLIDLATRAGQDELAEQFSRALTEEDEHLATIKGMLKQATVTDLI
ncbi:MAG: ferritin-like domain-containing protein [Pseudohongiella sp.]|nr:ferritin-like domain-containing protein [Pseudohongiella sp.]